MNSREIMVIGHKNPDTDSVCSAIAYANLKRCLTGKNYVAKRAGHINEETRYILKRFGVDVPEYIKDVRTQIKDIDIHIVEGVDGKISLREAWRLMGDDNIVTLPITKKGELLGLITIGDITRTYMEVQDSDILAKAGTTYKNILDTLEGKLLCGSKRATFSKGKVVVAAANLDILKDNIHKGDLVIVGNRANIQQSAIDTGVAVMVVCDGACVPEDIIKKAENAGCTIIATDYDAYTTSRIINQSMPISYFMRTKNLVTFREDDFLEDIQGIMANKRYRDFPVIDKDGKYVGMISRRNLLGARKKQLILVDHNERNQCVSGIEKTDILEIIDHHRLGTVETINPVFFRNQPLGSTATIVYQMYKESGVSVTREIAALLCSAIISDTLMYRSPTCTPIDRNAADELSVIAGLNIGIFARDMFNAGSNLMGRPVNEVFYQDYKKFTVSETTVGIGQINSMNSEDLITLKKKIRDYMTTMSKGEDIVYFLLTDIMSESSWVIYCGNKADAVLKTAFELESVGEDVWLKGVVSRKKQFLPAIVEALQQ